MSSARGHVHSLSILCAPVFSPHIFSGTCACALARTHAVGQARKVTHTNTLTCAQTAHIRRHFLTLAPNYPRRTASTEIDPPNWNLFRVDAIYPSDNMFNLCLGQTASTMCECIRVTQYHWKSSPNYNCIPSSWNNTLTHGTHTQTKYTQTDSHTGTQVL